MSSLNHANLDKLIAALEGAKDEQFNIKHVFADASGHAAGRSLLHRCGTAACVAGWALHVAGRSDESIDFAEGWLGLSAEQGTDLFVPIDIDNAPEKYTRLRAIDVLKHLRDTGEVDWDRFPAENYVTEGR